MAGKSGKYLRVDTDETTATWDTVAMSQMLTHLSQLWDASISSPSAGQVLTWNGSAWANQASSGGSATVTSTSGTLANGASVTIAHDSDTGPNYKRNAQFFSRTTRTKLLLHADGADGGTTFTDSSIYAHSLYSHGGAALRAAQKKFGAASAYFDGSSTYISSDSSSDYAFGTGDFTVDLWIYPLDVSSGRMIYESQNFGDSGNRANSFTLIIKNPAGNLGVWSEGAFQLQSATAISANAWTHVALVRASGVCSFYINGVKDVNAATWTENLTKSYVSLGRDTASSSQYFYGYMDEVRVSKGVARWTSNFTPPTAPYAAENGTVCLITPNCDGNTPGVKIQYADANGDNAPTCTTFINNTGAAVNYLATVQILP
jgi:hypothetical protein